MKLKDAAGWEKSLAANTDPYGAAALRFAERWADLMEARIAENSTVAKCAKACARAADTEGITGFMYGCAVSILSHVWERGEELRQWSNIDVQIGTEGERANAEGGVLNPALLSIG
jgi:hypothetical protein